MFRRQYLLLIILLAGCARNLAEQLVSSDENIRQAAMAKLETAAVSQRREIIPFLVDRLGSENGNLRRRAVQALSKLGPDAVNPLVRALQDSKNPRTRAAAAETLSLLGASAKTAAGPLVEAEQDADGDVRMWAAVALARVKSTMSPTERSLFNLLYGKKEMSITKSDAKAAALPAEDPRRHLSELRHANAKGRTRAVLALVERGPLAVPSLLNALTDSDESVRDGAAEALRLMTQDQADADEALVTFLKQGDATSKTAYDKAFKGLVPGAAPALASLTNHESLCVRLEAVRRLGALGPAAKDAAPALKAAAGDAHPVVRRAALRALRRVLKPAPTPAQEALARKLGVLWSDMTERLSRGEIEGALVFFLEPQRDGYRDAFLALGNTLPSMGRALGGKLVFREAFGDALVVLEGEAFIQGVHQTLNVQFVKDETGEWKIRGF